MGSPPCLSATAAPQPSPARRRESPRAAHRFSAFLNRAARRDNIVNKQYGTARYPPPRRRRLHVVPALLSGKGARSGSVGSASDPHTAARRGMRAARIRRGARTAEAALAQPHAVQGHGHERARRRSDVFGGELLQPEAERARRCSGTGVRWPAATPRKPPRRSGPPSRPLPRGLGEIPSLAEAHHGPCGRPQRCRRALRGGQVPARKQ